VRRARRTRGVKGALRDRFWLGGVRERSDLTHRPEQHQRFPRHAPAFRRVLADPAAQRRPQRRNRAADLRYKGLMHLHVYRVKLEPLLYYPAALTAEALAERLADAVVHEFAPQPSGRTS